MARETFRNLIFYNGIGTPVSSGFRVNARFELTSSCALKSYLILRLLLMPTEEKSNWSVWYAKLEQV